MTQSERELIDAHLGDRLEAKDHAVLQELLHRDANARRLLRDLAMVDTKLERLASNAPERMSHAASEDVSQSSAQRRFLWLNWRPLAAAAAGLAIGIFGAGLVFGYSAPKVMNHLLALANAGFEDQSAPAVSPGKHAFGPWSGGGEVVTAQGGITPAEGQRMLRFVSRKAAEQGTEPLLMTVVQLVDMSSWRTLLHEEKAIVDFSAMFNGASALDPVKATYRMDVRAYSGDVSVLAKPLKEREAQEVAHGMWRTKADREPSEWQRVSGRVILPPETDFLWIELKVFLPAHGASAPAPESIHYVDDVRISLVTTSGSQPFNFTSPTP